MAGSGHRGDDNDVALDETVGPDDARATVSDGPAELALEATVAETGDAALDATVAETGDAALDATVAETGDVALDATVAETGEVALEATMAADGGQETRGGVRVATGNRATRQSDKRPGRATLARDDELGRYVVLEMLGAGGMGEVYTAYDPELDRKVAIKVIRERKGGVLETAARSRLLAEAQSLAKLSHPNVVTVYDVGTVTSGDVYIAMEFIDGETLTDWLSRAERSWQEIAETMVEAGRGLAAAHDAGLIHRDFKPDNVLIGADGRVRVIDFGVALQSEERTPVVEDMERRELSPTTTGGLVGTPAYMAPEQFGGGEIGPATDQFAFGIALYQALACRLPFEGKTLLSLAENVQAGEVRDFPRDSEAPKWLQALVMRTLEVRPEDRYPSMDELLHDLTPRGTRSMWPIAVAILGVLFVGVGIAALVAGGDDEPCQGFERELGAVWNQDARQRVRQALGAEVYARIEPVLDDYGRRWIDGKEAACRATRVSKEQSERVLGLRNACLDTRLRELDSTIAVLAAGVSAPEQAAANLPSVARCSNLAALESGAPAPADADPDAVRAIETGLIEAAALNSSGKYDQGMELIEKVEAQARDLGWEAATSKALNVRGMLEANLGDPAKSLETAFEAVRLGASSGDASAEARAWIRLVLTEAGGMQNPKDALRWVEHARVALDEAGGEIELKARLAFNTASAYRLLRDNDKALGYYQEARALFERAHGPDHYQVARTRGAMATMLRRLGKLEEAEAEFRYALERLSSLFGPDSPTLTPLLNNLALLLRERGAYDEAMTLFERALAIKEEHLGREHPSVATTLINMALLAQRRGDFERVEELWARNHEIRVKALKQEHPKVTWSLYWKTLYNFNAGKNQESLDLARQVLARYRAQAGEQSFETAGVLAVICDLQRRLGKMAAARESCNDARSVFGKLPENHGRSYFAELYLTRIAVDQRQIGPATKLLAALADKLAKIKGDKLEATAHYHLVAARLAALRGDADEAKAQAEKAIALYDDKGAGYRYYAEQARGLLDR